MFSPILTLVLLLSVGIHGQTNDGIRSNYQDNGYSFGKIRLTNDDKPEELVYSGGSDKSQFQQDQSSLNSQPLPSPCTDVRSSNIIIHPKDKTKYIQCRDNFHYEIFSCPNGGDFNEQTRTCNTVIPTVDRCEQEKPCLNGGQCALLSDSSFKCTCRADWTGDRCESPMNSCVQKPCGPHAECRSLQISDFQQDYVCICNARKDYGLSCQDVVPNPCAAESDQFFPFAYSQRAYIQCDGELLFIQPCGPLLYWNQEEKICDRKRPSNVKTKPLPTKSKSKSKGAYSFDGGDDESAEETSTISNVQVSTTTEEPIARTKPDIDRSFAFIPTRVASRPPLPNEPSLVASSQSVQNVRSRDQPAMDLPSQVIVTSEPNNMRMNHWSQQSSRTDVQPVDTYQRQVLPVVQTGRDQPWQQSVQSQRLEPIAADRSQRISQLPIRTENLLQNIQQQPIVNQPWSSRVADVNTQINQRFPVQQPQPIQGPQNIQTQPWSQGQNQGGLLETTTIGQNIVRPLVLNNVNTREQDQVRSNQFTSQQGQNRQLDMGTQNVQRFPVQAQLWSQGQNQGGLLETTTSVQNIVRPLVLNNVNMREQEQVRSNTFTSQQGQSRQLDMEPQNAQRFPVQTQSWSQGQNQGGIVETTTIGQNVFQLQGFQNTNTRETVNSLPLNANQLSGSVDLRTPNTQNLAGQAQPWQNSQNQLQFTTKFPETTTPESRIRFNPVVPNQAQWQNNVNAPMRSSSNLPLEKSNDELDQSRLPSKPFATTSFVAGSSDQNQVQTQRLTADTVQPQQSIQQQPIANQPWSSRVADVNTQNIQRFPVQQQQPIQGSQNIQTQPWSQGQNQGGLLETTTIDQNIVRPLVLNNVNTREQEQVRSNQFTSQQGQNRQLDMGTQNVQRFPVQAQLWSQGQNQGGIVETTTIGQNIVRPLVLNNVNIREQDQVRSNQFNTQQGQNQPIVSQLKPWQETQMKQNQQSFLNEVTSQNQNKQFSSNQPQQRGNQFASLDDSRAPMTDSFTARPNSQLFVNQQQVIPNTFETITLPNIGAPMEILNGWKTVRNSEVRQPSNAPLGQQTFEQRRGPDTAAPLPLTSWQNRV